MVFTFPDERPYVSNKDESKTKGWPGDISDIDAFHVGGVLAVGRKKTRGGSSSVRSAVKSKQENQHMIGTTPEMDDDDENVIE